VELVVYAEANPFILCREGAEASASYGRVSVCLESLPSEGRGHLQPRPRRRRFAGLPRGPIADPGGQNRIAAGNPVLAEEPLERLTIQVWPGELMDPRVILWYDGWRPRAAPTNPHGLRALAGAEIDYSGMRAIGECPRTDGSSTVLIVDADGVYWEQVYRTEPPYDEILFELPKSELHRFELD
jgi:hypothetical protein